MSRWRREGLNLLPECKSLIEAARNPMALWIELGYVMEGAYAAVNRSLIDRLYAYAWQSWNARNADIRTAVAIAFYERLPHVPAIRADLPNRIDRQAFAELREVFRYDFRHDLSDEDFATFEREFTGNACWRNRPLRDTRKPPAR